MTNKRLLSWSTTMRNLGTERARLAGVREERLRAIAGLAESSLRLTSWRGRSGRRYVVGIHDLDDAEVAGLTEAVILAVRRGPEGAAEVVDIAAAGPERGPSAAVEWLQTMRAAGATEVHVHRLAEDEAERHAAMDDLTEAGGP